MAPVLTRGSDGPAGNSPAPHPPREAWITNRTPGMTQAAHTSSPRKPRNFPRMKWGEPGRQLSRPGDGVPSSSADIRASVSKPQDQGQALCLAENLRQQAQDGKGGQVAPTHRDGSAAGSNGFSLGETWRFYGRFTCVWRTLARQLFLHVILAKRQRSSSILLECPFLSRHK